MCPNANDNFWRSARCELGGDSQGDDFQVETIRDQVTRRGFVDRRCRFVAVGGLPPLR